MLADRMARSREWLLSHPEAIVPVNIEADYSAGLKRLAAGEPLPYVLAWWEFYGRRFNLTADVLIPRPETELLVEKGLHAIDEHPRLRAVIDLGTGSGCVGITLALERHGLHVLATDVSTAALSVARSNAARHGVGSRLGFVKSDLSEGLALDDCVVLANLPYVPTIEVAGLAWEPRLATDGGEMGLDVIGRLLEQLACRRPRRTTVLLEIGAGQGSALVELANAACQPARAWVEPDLAGHDRILGMRFGDA